MFPSAFIEPVAETTENKVTDTGVDFFFDYETGQHIMDGAVLAECSDLQTIRQYIQNVLRTQAKIYKVYTKGEDDVFGISLYEYIGQKLLPMGFINSELKREVITLLLKHPQIKEVKDWKGKRERHGLNITFTVVLTDGSLITESKTITV